MKAVIIALSVAVLSGCQSGYQYQDYTSFTPVPYSAADVAEVQAIAENMTPEQAASVQARTEANREYFEQRAQAEANAAALQAAYERQAAAGVLSDFAYEVRRQQERDDYEFYQRQNYYQQVQQTFQLQQIANSLGR